MLLNYVAPNVVYPRYYYNCAPSLLMTSHTGEYGAHDDQLVKTQRYRRIVLNESQIIIDDYIKIIIFQSAQLLASCIHTNTNHLWLTYEWKSVDKHRHLTRLALRIVFCQNENNFQLQDDSLITTHHNAMQVMKCERNKTNVQINNHFASGNTCKLRQTCGSHTYNYYLRKFCLST